MTRRIARLLACGLAAAVMWACGPVFIPVPPPAQTTFTLTTITDEQNNQYWIAAGGPEPKAANGTYYIFDEQRNSGVIAGAAADGSYQAPPMPGTSGDRILVNYKNTVGRFSAFACLILDEQRPAARCSP